MAQLIHDVIFNAARRTPSADALSSQGVTLDYRSLADLVDAAANALLTVNLRCGDRVAVFLDKREEAVIALFGASTAGAVFVPINPLLKAAQAVHILRDSNARVLVTSAERLALLRPLLADCPQLDTVFVTGAASSAPSDAVVVVQQWQQALLRSSPRPRHRRIDVDLAAILYTSGSTGKPKGVMLSHRNLVAGAQSVADYLGNNEHDRILAVLPLSFDYGLSQLTTAFSVGACVVLMNYLFPRDIINLVEQERITALAAVPPLWTQLAQLSWPRNTTLRYITNSGGAMPRSTLDALHAALPDTRIFLMYGLTEAFRSTFLPPDQIEVRPNSIGMAIPNAEVLVLRPDGSECAPGEPGELVHRGPLVALGYWNDPHKTAQRFRALPNVPGMPLPEIAVWSGDTVRRDDEGYLYFIGRGDDMIKSSGYRISPTDVEEVVSATGLVADVSAFGVPHPVLGQAIALLATARNGTGLDAALLLAACRAALPGFMVPSWIDVRAEPLPRNPNGKIDRKRLAEELVHLFSGALS